MNLLRRSPLLTVALIGTLSLLIILVRGLRFGPLHTDIKVSQVWINAYGFVGYMRKYINFNQRHLLGAPRNAIAYEIFGDNMLPFNLIFQISRILEGALMAGIIYQLTRRQWLAIAAGLALTFSPIRLAELYQSIAWGIETTLVLLLASTYFYTLFLRAETVPRRRKLYVLAFVCYAISILQYESGIPWLAVNALVGWFILESVPWQQRIQRIALHNVLFAILGVSLAIIVVFGFEPWDGLAPTAATSYPMRVLKLFMSGLTLPLLYWDRLQVAVHDGYALWVIAGGIIFGVLLGFVMHWLPRDNELNAEFGRDAGRLAVLGTLMLFCSVLVGASNPDMRYSYQNRITFARAAGIMLLYVTLATSLAYLLRRFVRLAPWQSVAMITLGVGLIGPSFAFVHIYHDEAQASYDEIENITNAILDVRCLFTRPLHMILVTDPDWVVARFPDTHDLILREAQIKLNEAHGDVTFDILKAGNEGYEDDYALPTEGSCERNWSSGLCLDENNVYTSRWAATPVIPNDDVVIVHYANDGTMMLMSHITVDKLPGYNIATAGPTTLKTNPARLAVPMDHMPVPLTGACPERAP